MRKVESMSETMTVAATTTLLGRFGATFTALFAFFAFLFLTAFFGVITLLAVTAMMPLGSFRVLVVLVAEIVSSRKTRVGPHLRCVATKLVEQPERRSAVDLRCRNADH